MYCIKCGKKLDNVARFCPVCGTAAEPNPNNSTIYKKKNKKKVWMILGFFSLILLAIVAIIIIRTSPSRELNRKIDLGNKYLDEANYEQAVFAYKDALNIEPRNKDARDGLVTAVNAWSSELAEDKEYDKAIDELKEVYALLPEEQRLTDKLVSIYIDYSMSVDEADMEKRMEILKDAQKTVKDMRIDEELERLENVEANNGSEDFTSTDIESDSESLASESESAYLYRIDISFDPKTRENLPGLGEFLTDLTIDGDYIQPIVNGSVEEYYSKSGELVAEKDKGSIGSGKITIYIYSDKTDLNIGSDGYDRVGEFYNNTISETGAKATVYDKNGKAVYSSDCENEAYISYTGTWLWGICRINHGKVNAYDASWITDAGW